MKIISNITFHAIPWVIEDIPAVCKVSIARPHSMYLMVCWSFQLLVTVYFIVVFTTSIFLTSQSVLSSSVSINMVLLSLLCSSSPSTATDQRRFPSPERAWARWRSVCVSLHVMSVSVQYPRLTVCSPAFFNKTK